ncbi:MAG: PD-(D/E)XK nuclease family protein [Steroidobacteraceae bacterium]
MSHALARGETVIVPSQQRAHAVRLAWAHATLASGRAAWHTPDVLSLDGWMLREIDRAGARVERARALSGAGEWWLWREATAGATRDTALAGVATLADALRRADRLAEDHDIDLTRWLAVGGEETRLLDRVRRDVQEQCRARTVDTAARLLPELAPADGETCVHFAGFAAANSPRARRLHARRHAAGAPGEWWETGGAVCAPLVEHGADEADEIDRLAAWCVERFAQRADARLLVVAAGSIESREAIASRVRSALAPRASIAHSIDIDLVAIDGGAPLARHALVRHALTTLVWLIDGLEFEEFSAWLRSPYGQPGAASGARLDLWWRRSAPLTADARASLALLARAATRGIEPAARLATQTGVALDVLGSGRADMRTWSERFSAALAALRPGEPAYTSDEQQAWLRFVQLLDEFGAVARLAAPLDARQALHALRDLATRTTWQASTGDALVTVSPAHDDPVVRYDGIWVAGLTADAWPAPPLSDAFVPQVALREAGATTASPAGRLAGAQANLAAWRAATPELVLSAARASGDMELAPSPLLAAWPRRASSAAPPAWLPRQLRQGGVRLERIEDVTGAAWSPGNALPGGTRCLELQAACPFRAHAELQLAAKPLDSPEPGIGNDVRGRWLHRALEIFWRAIADSTQLVALDAGEIGARAARAVGEARQETLPPLRDEEGRSREREARRLAQLIGALAELERTRAPFRIAGLEREHRVDLGDAHLRARIDRLDALEAGGYAVIDYKSGRLPAPDWYGARPTPVQLLVYAAAIGHDVRALIHARLAPPSPVFRGIAVSNDLLPGARGLRTASGDAVDEAWLQQLAAWESRLRSLAAEFLHGRATVTPADGACRYCHLAGLCRIGERAALEVAEEGGDE